MTTTTDRLAAALADRYRIERELGQGGMATVYLAEDPKHRRKVAIKVLRPELAAVIGAERFVREIQTIAALQHPHILGLIDSGEVNGTAYYVMPFIEGESLRDRLLSDFALDSREAFWIARQIAEGLHAIHSAGCIHGDVKPDNVQLTAGGSAVLVDLGFAHWLGDATSLNPVVATDGQSYIAEWPMFDSLVELDQNLGVRPLLAESWEVSRDGLTYTCKLKKGVRWHDGKPFTARDVAFTFYSVLDPKVTTPHRAYFDALVGFPELTNKDNPKRPEDLAQKPIEILDDHIPFARAGVRTLPLVDFGFSCWHKACDDLSAVSRTSLDAVGETLLELLRRL